MRFIASLVVALTILGAGPATAHAEVIINESFDNYADTNAFNAVWTPIGSDLTAPSALVSTTRSQSPPNSIRVPGTLTNNQYRNQQSFAETSTFSTSGNLAVGNTLIWSFDFYDAQLPITGNPARNYANLQDTTAPTGTNQLVAMGLNNNRLATNDGGNFYMARILGYTPPGLTSGEFFKLNDAGAPLRISGWNNLRVEIDALPKS